MMKLLHKIILLTGFMFVTTAYSSAALNPQPLTLSSAEINKLGQLFPSSDTNGEHVIWDKVPIDVVLPIEKERMITFPGNVDFGYDDTKLSDDKLTFQINDATIYLTAHSEFAPLRVKVMLVKSGKIILLNLSAKKDGSKLPIVVSTVENNSIASPSSIIASNAHNFDKPISIVGLTRFAAQKLYAPNRLEPDSPAIIHTPMQAYEVEPLLLDGSVIAHPKASWFSGNLYVTAVELRNQLPHAVELDPRKLCGHWRAATFYPRNILGPRGSADAATDVFLISTITFGKAVSICRPERGSYGK